MTRPSGRSPDELRPVTFTRRFTKHAEGSVLVEFGDTRVLCTASVEETRPAVSAREGPGLGDGGVRDVAARHAHTLGARSRQGEAERSHAGDPAPDRAIAARGGGSESPGRAHGHDRLRRAAGRRRNAHGVDHRRLRGAGRRLREARWSAARSPRTRFTARWPRSPWASSRGCRCSTWTTWRTRRRRPT